MHIGRTRKFFSAQISVGPGRSLAALGLGAVGGCAGAVGALVAEEVEEMTGGKVAWPPPEPSPAALLASAEGAVFGGAEGASGVVLAAPAAPTAVAAPGSTALTGVFAFCAAPAPSGELATATGAGVS